MKDYTDITILVDRSGSMRTIKEAMENALDEFITGHKEVPSTKVTLIEFDDRDDQNVVFQAVPVTSVEDIKLHPRGNTPLLDAFCKAIDNTGRRLVNMPESKRPDQVLMVVITDGQENASKLYKRQDVFNRVRKQSDDYKWEFVYLGANQDTFSEAASFGIPWTHAINYIPTAGSVGAVGAALVGNTVSYTNRSSAGIKAFTNEQRAKVESKNDTKTT